jgi:hypothetical protein
MRMNMPRCHCGDRVKAIDGLDEALAQADVAAGVVVGTERPADPGRDERDVRERARACVLEELVDRAHEREHARSPTQRDRQVGEVLRRGNASAREVLEDRRRAVLPEVQGCRLPFNPSEVAEYRYCRFGNVGPSSDA